MRRITTILFIIALLSGSAFAQDPLIWAQIYGGTGYDEGRAIALTDDGGFIITGETESFGAYREDIILVKTDANGDTIWVRTYGTEGDDCGQEVIQTNDGGFLIGGAVDITAYELEMDFLVMKVDENGDSLWSYTYDGGEIDCAYGLVELEDGSLIAAGVEDGSFTGGSGDVLMVKFDSQGNFIWQRTYDNHERDCAYDVALTEDGHLILGGSTVEDPYAPGGHIMLMKTDLEGNLIWLQDFGFGVSFTVEETNDGGYVVSGYTNNYGPGSEDLFLLKTDLDGDLQWIKMWGSCYANIGRGALELVDGGFIIYGSDFVPSPINAHYGYLVRTDDSGNTIGTYTYENGSYNYFYDATRTDANNVVLTGMTSAPGGGYPDINLVEFADDFGSVVANINPYQYLMQIPASGGVIEYDIEVVNNSPETVSVNVEIVSQAINWGVVYELYARNNIRLDPGQSESKTGLQQYVPARANWGPYSYRAVLYNSHNNDLLYIGSFGFDKLQSDGAVSSESDWILTGWDSEAHLQAQTPAGFYLYPAAPNPFNPSTEIRYQLNVEGWVKFSIYNCLGEEIAVLQNGWQNGGEYSSKFDAGSLPSGIYFAHLQSASASVTQKLLLLK